MKTADEKKQEVEELFRLHIWAGRTTIGDVIETIMDSHPSMQSINITSEDTGTEARITFKIERTAHVIYLKKVENTITGQYEITDYK